MKETATGFERDGTSFDLSSHCMKVDPAPPRIVEASLFVWPSIDRKTVATLEPEH